MKIHNTKRKGNENPSYLLVWINGHPALLTSYEAQKGIDRAKKQPEDVPSKFERLLAWFGLYRS